MYKALKDEKIIAINNTGIFDLLNCDSIVEDTEHTLEDYEQYNGEYILKQDVPVDYQNEQIRQQRKARYEVESDPLRLDYDEALARGEESAEQLKQEWLASKTKIRNELPYIVGENDPEYSILIQG